MKQFVLLVLAVLGVSAWISYADEGHDHGNKMEPPQSQSGMMHGEHGHSEESAHHRHGEWIDPPQVYADKVSALWADADAIERGEEIYQQNCVSCHGDDGQGAGPMAQMLSHPPADLNNNFHLSPGNGDAYLFWRVSEGGLVEPFKSQGSAMPAFKEVLSENERWQVLSYIHTFFHQGLMKWRENGVVKDNGQSDGDES